MRRRFYEHREGLVDATRDRRPLKLIAYIAVETMTQARSLERYLKTGSGFAFIKKRILLRIPAQSVADRLRILGHVGGCVVTAAIGRFL